jgi:hypothetical protein
MADIQISLAVAMVLLGAAGGLLGYLGARGLRQPVVEETEQHPNPIPPILVALYLGTGGAMIGYLLWAWLTRPNY